MGKTIKAMAVAFAATGLLAAGATAAQAEGTGNTEPAPATAANASGAPTGDPGAAADIAKKKYYKNVWHTAPSFKAGNVPTGGYLYAGKNYFYCQATGSTVTFKGYKNHYWLKTDDDSGNKNVWVNAVYISGGKDHERISGVPSC